MSVPVSVPFADDYLDSGTYPGLTELIAHPSNGFLYGCYEGSSPAANGRIVRIDQATFAQITVANLPKPNPIDMHYDPGTDRFYVIYRDDTLTLHPVTQVHPVTLAMVEFTSIEATLGPGSITGDGTKLYVVSFFDEPSYITPITLSTGAQGSAMPVTGFTKINCLRFFGTKLYAESLTEGGESVTVLRISNTGTVEEASEPIQITGGAFPVDDMGDSSADIWIGNKDTTGLIRKFSKSALTQLTEIATSQSSRCTCVKRVGTFIWATFENGRAIRIDPVSGDKRNYYLSQGAGYHSEITGDNSLIFTFNGSTSKIARYKIPSPSGKAVWAKPLGGSSLDDGTAVAFDPSGNIILGGFFRGTTNLHGTLPIDHAFDLASNGGQDIFLAKYDTDGNYIWAHTFGGAGNEVLTSLAVDSAGSIFVVGYYSKNGATTDRTNLGGANLPEAILQNAFIAKYNSSGVHQWSKGFGVSKTNNFIGVEIDSSGNAVVAGNSDEHFTTPLNLGGSDLVAFGGGNHPIIAKFDTDGNHLWSFIFYSQGSQTYGMALDRGNSLFVTGQFQFIDFSGGGSQTANQMSSHQSPFSVYDLFVAKFNSSGAFQWQKPYGDIYGEVGTCAATIQTTNPDGTYDVIIGGQYTNSTNLGGGAISGPSPNFDGFIVRYNGLDGSYRWATPIKSSEVGLVKINAIRTDTQNNVIATGYYSREIHIGSDIFRSNNVSQDIFVAKFNSSGVAVPSWASSHGGAYDDQGNAIAIDSSNYVAATGYFLLTATIGDVSMTSQGSADAYLMKIGP